MIETHADKNLLKVVLNRPEKRNALTLEMIKKLTQIFSKNDHKIILLEGSGDHFCSGLDLKNASFEEGFLQIAELYKAMTNTTAIIISNVKGICYAGGLGLVLASDLSNAAASSQFQLPEIKRGFLPALVLTLSLFHPFIKEMALTANTYTASALYEKGVINYLDAKLSEIIESLEAAAPQALALTKKMCHKPFDFDKALQFQKMALETKEYEEGLLAFREKRAPKWTS